MENAGSQCSPEEIENDVTMSLKTAQMRYDKQKFKNGAEKLQSKTVNKSPKDSYLVVDLPFASDSLVQDQYLNFRGGLRFGKLLEDIDAFAGEPKARLHEGIFTSSLTLV